MCVQHEASSSKKLRNHGGDSGLPGEPSFSEADPHGEPSEQDAELAEQGMSSRGASFGDNHTAPFGDHNAAQTFTTAVRAVV